MRERDSSGHMTGKSSAKPEYAKTDRYRFIFKDKRYFLSLG
jgi:hypothetical protein